MSGRKKTILVRILILTFLLLTIGGLVSMRAPTMFEGLIYSISTYSIPNDDDKVAIELVINTRRITFDNDAFYQEATSVEDIVVPYKLVFLNQEGTEAISRIRRFFNTFTSSTTRILLFMPVDFSRDLNSPFGQVIKIPQPRQLPERLNRIISED